MKKLLLLACIATISCSKKEAPKIFLDHDYAIDIVDDSVYLYTEDDKLVGAVKLEGQLDRLITLDNQ